ncbi:hypothetical protein VIBRN418_06396 [Vibrio sp. N418]|nr:hypothetical protein VIBRN418_06396 [Vibrio sp. N418]
MSAIFFTIQVVSKSAKYATNTKINVDKNTQNKHKLIKLFTSHKFKQIKLIISIKYTYRRIFPLHQEDKCEQTKWP